jgi:long-chain acyl-CoA synthetase
MAMLEVMGVTVLQGWGMTETTGPLAVCNPRDRRRGAFGTCGNLFPNARALIEGEELIVEGPQIAKGYVEPDGTVVPFNGRKHTGDRGGFDDRHRLLVLGKVSDRITTDNGFNYYPVPMEDDLKAKDLNLRNVLEEAVVIGDARSRLGCVFFLREGIAKTDEIEAYLSTLIQKHNEARAVDEQVGPWTISPQSLGDAGGLGPSGKLVRRKIEERFATIYGEVLV